MKTVSELWREMSELDRKALNELSEEENVLCAKTGEKPRSKFELLRALTPDGDQP